MLALSMPGHVQGDGSAWLAEKGWPVRRIVAVEAKLTPGAGGDEVGVVEIPTDMLAKPDGADIRVANSAGRAIPMRVLSVGPGSLARVAFAVQPGRNNYAVYYGNPSAGPPGKELDLTIRRGLLLETCNLVGGGFATYDGTAAIFRRARSARFGLQGCDFVDHVFHGHNLFGPSGRTISRYSGFLQIPAAGDYGFATSSDDASFMRIDGKAAVEWGGFHGWVGDARHNRTVALTAGVHEFEYLHVNIAGDGGAVAAWKPPGATRWLPIPPTTFLPVFRGTLKEREKFGTTRTAEMAFANVGETVIGDEDYIQRYRFICQPTGFDAKAANFAWTFGDGTSAAGVGLGAVEHIFLTNGPTEVGVTVSQLNQRDAVSNQVVVSRNWRTVAAAQIDGAVNYARLVSQYDFARMRPGAVARAMELCKRARLAAGYEAAGHALATAAEPVDDRLLIQRVDEYAKALIERDPAGGPARAINDYLAAAGRASSPPAKAAMLVGAGRVWLDQGGNDVKAEGLFNQALALKDRGADRAIKAAWIGMGDVHRRRGDGAKALAAYQAAEKTEPAPAPNKAAIEVGSLARSIEFYIRQGDFITARQQLEDWDWQFPTHKLAGYSTWLWVMFYQAQKMHRQAIREAGDLVAAADRSNYAPQLLLAAAESHVAQNERAKAKQLLEHLVAMYPESPLVADAKKRLKEIGG